MIKALGAIVALSLIGGGMYDWSHAGEGEAMKNDKLESMTEAGVAASSDGMMEGTQTVKTDKKMMEEGEAYMGTVLAGKLSPVLDFKKADYERALSEGKAIVLYFYADWCPVCKAEFPVMRAAFDAFGSGGVVGFRVNFKDNSTDEAEVALAREFGVAYQHTKVLIKGGKQLLKSPESWDRARYDAELLTLSK